MTEPTPGVVDLPDAGVPADQGLSSLGLLMQLGGHVFAAYAALAAFFILITEKLDHESPWILLVFGLSLARSLVQRSAGARLLYGQSGTGEGDRLAGTRRYIGVSLAQSVLVCVVLMTELHMGFAFSAAVLGGLVAWPVTLGILLQLPRFKRYRDGLPVAEDKGFEGAAILMTVLGLCGLFAAGTALLVMLGLSDQLLQHGPMVLVVLAIILLVTRSAIHAHAGISGLRETSLDRSVERANRYANFGVISAFCAGGAMLLLAMSSLIDLAGIAVVCALVWMLMCWPLIIRRFFSDRQFSDLLAGDAAPVHRRAPDAGLTALGWLLLADAVLSIAFALPQLAFTGSGNDTTMWYAVASLGGAVGAHSVWWAIALAALQAWAGFELIRMSPPARGVATLYGLVCAGVTCYLSWPLVSALYHASGFTAQSVALGPLALALILPVSTIVLVNRKISPAARARFRPRPAPANA